MNLVIVSSSPAGRVARRIQKAATAHAMECRIVGVDDIATLADSILPDTVVLPRISPEQNEMASRLSVLQARGAYVINPADSWVVSRDKWRTYERLKEFAVPTPKTVYALAGTIFSAELGLGEQAIFKPRYGTHGEGIIVVKRGDTIPREEGVLQEYIDTGGADIRLFVVGERVVAAMQRQAKPGDFRANLHQGATARRYVPDDIMQQVAVRAAKSMGLAMAGVDVLGSAGGAVVIEVNPSPGLGIEQYADSDVAGAMIEAIAAGLV